MMTRGNCARTTPSDAAGISRRLPYVQPHCSCCRRQLAVIRPVSEAASCSCGRAHSRRHRDGRVRSKECWRRPELSGTAIEPPVRFHIRNSSPSALGRLNPPKCGVEGLEKPLRKLVDILKVHCSGRGSAQRRSGDSPLFFPEIRLRKSGSRSIGEFTPCDALYCAVYTRMHSAVQEGKCKGIEHES